MNQKYVIASVEQEACYIKAEAENIASFIMKYGMEGDIEISTLHDYPLLTTSMIFLDRCYDQEFVKELQPVLAEMQMGDREPCKAIAMIEELSELPEHAAPVPDWDCDKGHGIFNMNIFKPLHEWKPEEDVYTVISSEDIQTEDDMEQ